MAHVLKFSLPLNGDKWGDILGLKIHVSYVYRKQILFTMDFSFVLMSNNCEGGIGLMDAVLYINIIVYYMWLSVGLLVSKEFFYFFQNNCSPNEYWILKCRAIVDSFVSCATSWGELVTKKVNVDAWIHIEG